MTVHVVVIEGQAGAGKTPFIEALKNSLSSRGYETVSVAPFTIANSMVDPTTHPLGIFDCWSESHDAARRAESLLESLVWEGIGKTPDEGFCILDRGWLTVCRGLMDSCLPEDEADALMKKWKAKEHPTIFLDTEKHITQGRGTWNPAVPWTNGDIDRDFLLRREMIAWYPQLIHRHFVDNLRIDLAALADSVSDSILSETARRRTVRRAPE